MPVFLVGFRLVPHHLAQICQYPFNGIPHGVELRILERVGEVQVDRNIAATDIQRPIWVADFRTHAETCPCVDVCFAAGWDRRTRRRSRAASRRIRTDHSRNYAAARYYCRLTAIRSRYM